MTSMTKRRMGVLGLVTLELIIGYSHFMGKKDATSPILLQGLPVNFEDAREQLQTRLNEEFVLPVPEQDLINLLSQQGFGVSVEGRNARFSKSKIACDYVWDINWGSQSAVVTKLKANVGAICV